MTSFSHTTLWSIWPDRIRSVQNDEMLVIGCTAPFHTLILAHGPLRGLVLNCLSRFGVRKPYERPSAISTARRCMCHRRRCILKRSAHSRDSTNPILRLCAVAVTGRVIARTDCGRWRSCWSTTTVDQALHCRGNVSNRGDMSNIRHRLLDIHLHSFRSVSTLPVAAFSAGAPSAWPSKWCSTFAMRPPPPRRHGSRSRIVSDVRFVSRIVSDVRFVRLTDV